MHYLNTFHNYNVFYFNVGKQKDKISCIFSNLSAVQKKRYSAEPVNIVFGIGIGPTLYSSGL